MANGRSEDIGRIGAGALKFLSGAFRAKPSEETIARQSGLATAGTSSKISPSIRDRISGAFGATRAVQAFEGGRAGIEGRETLTRLQGAQAATADVALGRSLAEERRLSRLVDVDDFIIKFGVDPNSEEGKFIKELAGSKIDIGTNSIEERDVIDLMSLFQESPVQQRAFFERRLKTVGNELGKAREAFASMLEKAAISAGKPIPKTPQAIQDFIASSNDIKLSSAFLDMEQAQQIKQGVLTKMGVAQQKAQETTKTTDLFGKVSISDFTPESLEAFKQSGNFADLVPVEEVETPTKRRIVAKIDPVTGKPFRVDLDTGERLPVGEETSGGGGRLNTSASGQTGEQLLDGVSRTRRTVLITPQQAKAGSGVASNLRQGFNRLFGMFVPGEIAPKTEEARNAIRSFNQLMKAGFTINPKNPVAELRTIEGFTLDVGSSAIDPDANITRLINIVERLESVVITGQDLINNNVLSKSQNIATSNNVNNALRLLAQIPTTTQLKVDSGRGIDVEDVEKMSIDEIKAFPKENITNQVAKAMLEKLGVK